MKALIWCAPYKVKVERVPDPKILNRRDAIVRMTSTCICGSDLHLVDGFVPFMKPGDILGHEPMGIVEEVGPDVDKSKVKVGDRVVVPFPIGCGECFFCKRAAVELLRQHEHQAVHRRADVRPRDGRHLRLLAPDRRVRRRAGGVPPRPARRRELPGHAARTSTTTSSCSSPTSSRPATWPPTTATSSRDDTVAVWGCGPVGQFTIRSAMLLGAAKVIAIDNGKTVPERLQMAARRRRDHDRQQQRRRLRPPARPDRRHRPGRRDRRRRHGGPRLQRRSRRLRQGQDQPDAGDRAPGGHPAGRSSAAARAAPSRSPACTAGWRTRSRSAR